MAARAGADSIAGQADAGGLEGGEAGFKIRDAQRDVVQAFAALGEKAAEDGFGLGGFEELPAGWG